MNRTLAMLFLVASPLVGLTACFPSSGPALGNVTGTVTLDGKPLPNAMISFYPTSGLRSAHGTTDGEGKYLLRFTGMKDGALVGEHRVKIEVGVQTGEAPAAPAGKLPKLPAKYNAESELTAEVERGSNTIDFDLKSN
ncbi:carboxypeptidase-like regulatory domain-containing protein [Blastopirellula sp. JC732]|uniref:Carboxypeptidase-like regulatory domain-containing protein n=1 Tax=Blastopirellula sediminis TaxID=2894196 RepID=A0A9X1SMR2_9BACT|nr:carboxypeptidase-like regulatory domain-containing protein [Blastopirellula sediminis]MCC9604752.1 carboxypeptidase-like regulatory domain-containing protein [Blastopirellula sediminis]MCC9631949.1 carboxypeptidase-like regulatory domain-containing protein [Blastopirellula sediminis]